MKLLISACLLGTPCRYDGQSKPLPEMERLLERHTLIPVCPEILGGLPTPRPPAERRGGRVVTEAGGDVTEAYGRGAAEVVRLARLYGCDGALLKERSPSCGSGVTYDGTFSKTVCVGWGIAAQALRDAGFTVWGESQMMGLLEENDHG